MKPKSERTLAGLPEINLRIIQITFAKHTARLSDMCDFYSETFPVGERSLVGWLVGRAGAMWHPKHD